MRQKGFIGLLILIGITCIAIFIIKINFSKMPSQKTIQVANSITHYPKVNNWQIIEKGTFCFNPRQCYPSVKIIFETNDSWANIYGWYNQRLTGNSWNTNSQIFTSIPSSIIFFNYSPEYLNCQVDLDKNSKTLFLLNSSEQMNSYSFNVTCPD